MRSESLDLISDLNEMQRQLRQRARGSAEVLDCVTQLASLRHCLAERPRLVLLGESNSGKTALANMLMTDSVLPESILANTRHLTILRHSQSVSVTGITSAGATPLSQAALELASDVALQAVEVELPDPRLERFDLVDTPGISDPDDIQALQLRPGDLLIWCTVATQAWKESERVVWQSLSRHHQRDAIVVATHLDGLEDARDVASVRARLLVETRGSVRGVAMVSSVPEGAESGMKELEGLIAESLDAIATRRRAIVSRMASRVAARAIAALASP